MGRRMDVETQQQRRDRARHEIHNKLPRRLLVFRNHHQPIRQRHQITCSIEELMQSLDVMVKNGKVLYLGVSDTPAWIVAKCNEYARQKGLRQFSVYQGQWSAEKRSFERDIIPMSVAGA